ncbi:reverse transcriptase Ty1/copia-type domain-containing protein [Citrus sinensis]|uniref:Reverse transcriptase Ty1/copia-type domain-containing protein n=1 Tax=Citrus sinensis TaxID=2711 RepID=A0ACB8MDC6_CITSI|nr:reverse transcriptase Ty1/copia-type domain-containing protein [Citrus sinensis]
MLWRSQVISSIRASELEGFVDGSHTCPPRFFTNPGPNGTTINTLNHEYQIWQKQDHILLSWLLSSLSEGVLGTVVDCYTSCEVWTTLANQFGARTRARILHLRTQIQTTKKGLLTIHDYYSKMKSMLNQLRAVGNNMTDDDFVMCVLAGLGPEYDSIVTNINSMPESPSISEGCNDRSGNQYQPGIAFRNPGSGVGNNQGSQNPQDKGKGKAMANDDSSDSKGPCQICLKMGHTAAEYWHSGATNHVTNALGNISMNSEYQSNDQLAVGNGKKLFISHIACSVLPTCDPHKHIALNNILYVPDITKNLISISKLLHDNEINVEFYKSVCFVKDKKQGKILMKGVARDGLYELLCLPAHLGKSKLSNATCLSASSVSESIRSISDLVSMLSFSSNGNESASVSESSITDKSGSSISKAAEEIDLWHLRLGHPNVIALKNTLLSSTYSHSQDTAGSMEHTPNLVQDEAQHTLDTDILSESKKIQMAPLTSSKPDLLQRDFYKHQLRQVDINNAFLNGELTETVYMPQPEGFEDKNKPNHICKLNKALYGLRQAPRAWFDKLKSALHSWNFENSKCDTSLFFKKTKSDITIMLIYVDDIIITGSNCEDVEEVVVKLSKTFALKDLGDLNFFLRIQVARTHDIIQLSQTKYIQDLLTKIEMADCKGIETLFSTSEKLRRNEGARFHDPTLYRSVIGSLQYAVLTRPELAFSVNKLNQYMSDPRQPHWTACKRILRYLKSIMNIAMALCSAEITWISSLLSELKLKVEEVPVILSDSTSAAAIAAKPVYHSKTKHFEIDLHFIRDKVMKGEIEISYVASKDQTADVLTKPLPHYNSIISEANSMSLIRPCV